LNRRNNAHNPAYRPEIDGLRTIAVMAVMLYHAEFTAGRDNLFPGGFLGVDVFFAISGFLITTLLLSEIHETGRISLSRFYERRARRLLPALLVVMLASIPFAWRYLVPEQLIEYAKSLVSTLLFGSNFFWDYRLQQYDAESALQKPFLHTWSLAVEEQYYIVFPLLLLALLRWRQQFLLAALLLGFVLSLLFAQYMTTVDPWFSFYMLPTRFWELLAGGLLAVFCHRYSWRTVGGLAGRAMPVAGLALILFSIAFYSFDRNHPGIATLPPVLGTLLIIGFANGSDPVTKFLSHKLMVAIGLVSYSLYLWHYPVFAFGRLIDSPPSNANKALWFTLTFLLSILTYFALEKPFRRKDKYSRTAVIRLFCTAALVILAVSSYAIAGGGLRERFAETIARYGENEFDNSILRNQSWSTLAKMARRAGYAQSQCCSPSEFEKSVLWFSGNKTRVLVIGDSHSKDLFNAFYLNRKRFKGYEFARYQIYTDASPAEIEDLLASPNFRGADIVLISGLYGDPHRTGNESVQVNALPGFIDAIRAEGKKVILASVAPSFEGASRPKTLYDKMFDAHPEGENIDSFNNAVNTRYFEMRRKDLDRKNSSLEKIAREKGIEYMNKLDAVCDSDRRLCYGVTPKGLKSFYDDGHWTIAGAKFFGKRMYKLGWLNADRGNSG
jgi:peptidoglycan/LPS O-acetylase OafA/YrhL